MGRAAKTFRIGALAAIVAAFALALVRSREDGARTHWRDDPGVLASREPDGPVSEITYQGQRFTLPRTYSDFDEFQENSSDLPAELLATLAAKQRAVAFGPNFRDEVEMFAALDAIEVPGFGWFFAAQHGAMDLAYVEVPGDRGPMSAPRGNNRYFALSRGGDGTLRVVDDFVAAAQPEITSVRGAAGALHYFGNKGQEISPDRE